MRLITDWLGVSPLQLLLIEIVCAVAGFIRGLTGFGLAIVLVPLISLIIPPDRTVLLAILIASLGGGMGYRAAWQNVDRPRIIKLVIAAAVAMPLGMYALFVTPPDVSRLLITAIAVAAFFVIAMPRAPLPPPGDIPVILTGLVMGFLGAFAAIPGPPVILYFVRSGIPATVSRDTMIVIFFWGPLMVALLALAFGRIDLPLALLAVAGTPALMAGNAVGSRYFGKMPESQWRWIILGLISVSVVGSVVHLFM
jgi:uncharacterized membrane protein YfcA